MSGLDTRAIETEKLGCEPCPKVKQEFRVFLREEAFDRAVARGHESPAREIGGILVGDLCRDDAGPYVRVDTTIDALHADEKGTELTFTHATWKHVHQEMDEKHQGQKILGWYHTHPGFGIFLSDRDRFIQRSFFNLPFQIALVYDPRSREHGVFVWRDNEPRRSRRHWVGEREHIWDGAPPARAPEAAAPHEKEADAMSTEEGKDPAAPERGADWFGLALAGAVLLFLGGLLGWWLGGRGTAEELARARRQIDAQGAFAAQQAYRTLQRELLGLLRSAVGSEALRGPIDDAVASLDRSLAALEEANAPENAVAEIKAAKRRLLALRDDSTRAEKTLRGLAEAQRGGAVDPREIRRLLNRQAGILGQICVEVAATTPDKRAARRLLRNAMAIDPGNARIYEKKLQELGK